MMFSRTVRSAKIPSLFLSSEQKPIPAIIALLGRLDGRLLSLDLDFTLVGAVDAENEARHFRPSGAQESGQSEHLAFVQAEIEGRNGAAQSEILHGEQRSCTSLAGTCGRPLPLIACPRRS